MEAWIAEHQIAGVSTRVSRRGQVVHEHHCGLRNIEAGLPQDADTIHRIYSMTKPVVSTALMMLHERAAFQLDEPVAKYLPAFASTPVMAADGSLETALRPMQIRDLLTHTSGLTYDFLDDYPVAQQYRDRRLMNDPTRTLAELIDELAEVPLAFQPGSAWHYSVGIDVAARLIEVLADPPLHDYLHDEIFDPLGMVDTDFGVSDDKIALLAEMYGLPDLVGPDHKKSDLVAAALSGFNEHIDVSATYPTNSPDVFCRGGVGLFSTLDDFWRFAQMLQNGGVFDDSRIIGRKTLELMHMNHVPNTLLPLEIMGDELFGLGFGLGSRSMIDVAASAGPGSVGEFGWAGAARTYYWVDPVEDLVGVMMTQYMTGVHSPDRVFRSLVYAAITD